AGFIAFTSVNPLREAGCGVTLIEREPSVLPRMLDREGAGVLRHWMSSQGIHSFVGTELLSIEDDPRGRKRLLLKDQALPVEADVVIVATGIAPNVEWLKGSGLALNRGVLVDATLKTSDPSVYAAGDIAETLDPRTGQRGIMAIEVAAMEQGRIIGAAMAGRAHDYAGSMLMNVVETAGLQAASFGNWAGDDYTEDRAAGGHYRRYVWAGDTLTGGVIIGPARRMAAENDMGMLKGLIQAGQPLGAWKDLLVHQPFELKKVYLASRAVSSLLPRMVLGTPSLPLAAALAGAGGPGTLSAGAPT
ncbi:MAG: NAD(P)/FAD-dependent oxidoreductase, partial [Chloroflexota bacterium]